MLETLKKIVMNNFPYDAYYKIVNYSKKYFNLIIKPSIVFTFFIGLVYVCIAFLFRWQILIEVFYVIFVAILIAYIVWGILYGESQKGFYLKDD